MGSGQLLMTFDSKFSFTIIHTLIYNYYNGPCDLLTRAI